MNQLVNFSVDTNEESWISDRSVHSVNMLHKRLLDLWMQYGILVLPGMEGDFSELIDAISNLPHDAKTAWQHALKKKYHFRRRWASVNFGDLESEVSLRDIQDTEKLSPLSSEIDLLCVGDELRSLMLGIPDGEEISILDDHDMEICKLEFVDQTDSFQNAIILSSTPLTVGRRVIDIWKERFQKFTIHSKNIVIQDRYCLEDIHKEHNGLKRCLSELSGDGNSLHVEVFCQAPSSISISNAFECLDTEWASLNSRGGIRNLKITVVHGEQMALYAHGRYIRFDESVCTLDGGVRIFESSVINKECIYSLIPFTPEIKNKETNLRRYIDQTRIF